MKKVKSRDSRFKTSQFNRESILSYNNTSSPIQKDNAESFESETFVYCSNNTEKIDTYITSSKCFITLKNINNY